MLCSLDDNATRRDITLAYLDLLCKKNADEVTVSDVTRRAGVSRPTFYHYFSGTVDILHHLAVLMLDGMRAAGGGGGMRDLTLEQFVQEVFRHMEKNRDVLLAVSDAEGLITFFACFRTELQRRVIAFEHSSRLNITEERSAFVLGGAISLLHFWVARGMDEPADALAERAITLGASGTDMSVPLMKERE